MQKLRDSTILNLVRRDGTTIYFGPDTDFFTPETDEEKKDRIYKSAIEEEETWFFEPQSITVRKNPKAIPELPQEEEIPEEDR